ncbi:MAG: hypothetical protein HYZ71_13085 [Deltaproteobacteria bacterium]|nr:hypothetical protein [Deltaproteobacteria bacterium]
MSRAILSVLVLLSVQVSLAGVKATFERVEQSWDDVTCELKGSELTIHWDNGLTVKLKDFKSLSENTDLLVKLKGSETGSILFRENQKWTISDLIPESSCRIQFSEMAHEPLGFKVALNCENLVVADALGSGMIELDVETSDRITCQTMKLGKRR